MSMRIIIFGAALLAAGLAGFMAMNLSAPAPEPVQATVAPAPQIALDEVLIATTTLTTGRQLDGQLRWQEWPSAAVGPGFITKASRPEAIEEFKDSIVRSTIAEGEPIRSAKLLGADQSFMSSILPSGKRAVATEIAEDTSAGGFILPDDYVDVIMTTRGLSGGALVTETILENIRVLAIDQTIREDEEGRLVQVGRTATLELTPKQAEIMTAAQQIADRMTLALRSIQDVNTSGGGRDAEYLLNGTSNAVTIIKSGTISTVNR
ncbi:MAG: Flp pilus assembly protein CpaB [Pseudomonadota bacterium]